MSEKKGPDHYRYEAVLEHDGVHIEARRFVVIGETPKCWYIVSDFYANWLGQDSDWHRDAVKKARKRVLKHQDHGRRYAYTDKRLAMFSLKKRLQFKLSRMRIEHSIATLALDQEKALYDSGDQHLPETVACGHDDITAGLDYSDC